MEGSRMAENTPWKRGHDDGLAVRLPAPEDADNLEYLEGWYDGAQVLLAAKIASKLERGR